MRRKSSMAMAAVLLAGSIAAPVAVSAEEAGYDEMMAMALEIQQIENLQIEGGTSTTISGTQVNMSVIGKKGESGISEWNINVEILDPAQEQSLMISLEDLLRVNEDGCFIHVGEFFDALEELSAVSVRDYVPFMKDWLHIPVNEWNLPAEQMGVLTEDIQTKVMEGMSEFPVTAIENGYEMDMTLENSVDMMEAIFNVIGENMGTWMTEGLEIAKELDYKAIGDTVVPYVISGIKSVDEEFDDAEVTATVEQVYAMLPQVLETMDSETVMAQLSEEDLDFSQMIEELRAQMDEVQAQANIDGVYQFTKDADGVYTISYNMNMTAEGETAVITAFSTATPIEAFTVDSPQEYTELSEVIEQAAALVYQMNMLSEEGETGSEAAVQ